VLGAQIRCDKGSHAQNINLPESHGTTVRGRPMLHEGDNKHPENIPCFGVCTGADNDSEETVAYVAQSGRGNVTGRPCLPLTTEPWNRSAQGLYLWSERALTTDSYLVCTRRDHPVRHERAGGGRARPHPRAAQGD
jgi:hypothetical protein